MTRPLRLELVIAHFVESAGAAEEEAEGVLGDGVIVETDAGGDGDLGGVESRAEDVVGACGEGLDPAQVLHAAGGIVQVVGAVGPGDKDLGVDKLLRDWCLNVVGVEGDGEALEALDVELDGGWVEELHLGGCGGVRWWDCLLLKKLESPSIVGVMWRRGGT